MCREKNLETAWGLKGVSVGNNAKRQKGLKKKKNVEGLADYCS